MKNLELRSLVRQPLRNTENVDFAIFAEDYHCIIRHKLHSDHNGLKASDVLIYNVNNTATDDIFEISEIYNIIQCEYLQFHGLIWIGTKKEFILIDPTNRSVRRINHYASSEDREILLDLNDLENAYWDPTGNFIIVGKLDGTISVFVIDFTDGILEELETSNICDVISKTEQLNWGSAECQFRSQEEQLLIKAFKDEVPIMEETSVMNISWRQNGENVVVNYNNEGKRKLKVYDEAWKLIYESEDIPGLQSVIAWKASSVVFTGVVHTSKRTQVIIFEKNCEVKNRYDLERKAPVNQLKWNDSGDILAVYQKGHNEDNSNIDLYTFKNSTMYLKQRLLYTNDNPLINFEFLKSDHHLYEMRTITKLETVTYSYKFAYNSSVIQEKQPHALCVVIQGPLALIMYCTNGMRPPPEYDLLINVQNPINFIFFHPRKPLIAFVDCLNNLSVYDVTEIDVTKIRSIALSNKELPSVLPLKYHHFLWISDARINYLEEPISPGYAEIVGLSMEESKFEHFKVLSTENSINYIGLIKNSTKMLQQIGNEIIQITETNIPENLFSLHSVPINIKSILIDDQVYVFSLMSNASFCIDQVEVLNDVISFILYDNYLFLTTLKGTLMGIRLNKQSLTELTDKNLNNIYLRQIEQGSHLICGIPSTPYIVSQMPRGNIELYSCRLIVVDTLDALLEKNKWVEALEFVRSTRLNMNTLVDLDFTRFMSNIEMFINAAKVPDTLSDFLIELQDMNVFNAIYTNCLNKKEEIPKKVEFICDVMMNYMEQTNYIYYINTIITACFVKNTPNCCKNALFYIQTLLKEVEKQPKLMNIAEKAYKIALTFRSATEMYKTALLTYDLNLILFIAMNSGIEPSEFVPFIRELQTVDLVQRCFKIHDFLKQYNEALKYLIQYGTDEEVFNYTEQHGLFEQAQWCIKPNTKLYPKIVWAVAQNLSNQNKFEEAAVYFKRVKANEKALEEYIKALCWHDAIDIMKNLGKTNQEISEILHRLIDGLKNTNRIKEAAKIYDKHLNDYESGIMLCVEQKFFDYAVKLAIKHNRHDIYETDITVAVLDYCKQLHEKFTSMLTEFLFKEMRLTTIREEKRNRHSKDFPITSEIPDDLQDHVSLAASSTIASMRSTSSRKTSRSRRKQERKKHSTREGGIFEDIALMEALYNLVYEAFQWGPKVQELCLIALKFEHLESVPKNITQMYCSLLKLQKTMQSHFQNIWPPTLSSINVEPNDAIVFENISQLDVKYRVPPNNTKVQWELRSFSVL